MKEASNAQNEVVISFESIFRFFRKNKWRMLVYAAVSGFIGAGYSTLLISEYTSSVTLLPEIQNRSGSGGFKALANLAGFSLDNMQSTEAIRPDLYPNILASKPFLLKVADLELPSEKGRSRKTIEMFLNESVSKIDVLKSSLFKEKKKETTDIPNHQGVKLPEGILVLSKKDEDVIKAIRGRIATDFDKKTGIFSIAVTMPDPDVSAFVADFSMNYLVDYISSYRNGKEAMQVEFLKKQMVDAEQKFKSLDARLRSYSDRNRNPFLTNAVSGETKLRADLSLAQDFYQEVTRQYEQAALKLKEESPAVKILDPPQVPLMRSSPKRVFMTMGFFFAGLIVFFVLEGIKAAWRYAKEN